MASSKQTQIPQGVARRLIPLRWARSQKLLGYYDSETHALIYQDTRGQIVDRVELPSIRSTSLTNDVK